MVKKFIACLERVEAGQWRRCRKGTTIFFDGVDIQKKNMCVFLLEIEPILKETITHTLYLYNISNMID